MGMNPSKLLKFWQELKRRKVVKVLVLYATTAFILLEAVSLVIAPLNLPEWILTMVIVILMIGFPIALIFSWIFDITPEGIEVTVGHHEEKGHEDNLPAKGKGFTTNIIIGVLILLVGILVYPKLFNKSANVQPESGLGKSIAVLPFTNDSNDSSNIYIINGLMESVLNNLAKIEDLRVISRTSVEKYRNNAGSQNPKLMPEIGADLDVNYIVEGSGQKYNDEIFLTVQLLEASTDRHLWSNQYKRKTDDIIDLQIEVAKNIAAEIQVLITPEEEERIKKAPTDNPVAYDYYLKGIELLYSDSQDQIQKKKNLNDAIAFFENAIEEDDNFALAYAKLSYTYFRLDRDFEGEDYDAQINWYADKALLADPQLSESLVAKGLYYVNEDLTDLAILYFEKSLVYNPNSAEAIKHLVNIFSWDRSNTEKYLEYALRAVRLDVATKDSAEITGDFIRLSIALRYSGFFTESEEYSQKAGNYGYYPFMERAELMSDMEGNFQGALDLLLANETDSLEIMHIRFMAQTYFFLKDYPNAEKYYREIIEATNSSGDFRLENDYGRIAFVFSNNGKHNDSEYYLNIFEKYANSTESSHRYRHLAEYYALKGNSQKVFENMKAFAGQENYPYWTIRFFKYNPIYDKIRNTPEFQEVLGEIESNFWTNHKRLRKHFEEDGFL